MRLRYFVFFRVKMLLRLMFSTKRMNDTSVMMPATIIAMPMITDRMLPAVPEESSIGRFICVGHALYDLFVALSVMVIALRHVISFGMSDTTR